MPSFETRAAFHAWLEAEGLNHLARLNLEALAPFVPPSEWPELHRIGAKRRLSEVASDGHRARLTEWMPSPSLRQVVKPAFEALLHAEQGARHRAHQELSRRMTVPGPLGHALLELRRSIPSSVAPRPASVLGPERLRFDASLPGYVFTDDVPTELPLGHGAFGRAKVLLSLTPERASVRCSCVAQPCVHELAAIDAVLLRLLEGAPTKEVETLLVPSWRKAIERLDAALETTEPHGDDAPSFLIRVESGEVFVEAWDSADRLTLDTLPSGTGALDRALVALLPSEAGPASSTVLNALVGHPRVFLADDPKQRVTVERAEVGIAADERHQRIHVVPSIDGAPAPPHVAAVVLGAPPGAPLFLWDPGPRLLTVLELKPQLRAAFDALRKQGDTFPLESRASLLEALTRWAAQVPVTMPRSVMGTRVSVNSALVLRLTSQRGGPVELEVRVRPLPDAPALQPGRGAPDLFLRRAQQPVHAVRDLREEEAHAQRLVAELPLTRAEPLEAMPYTYLFRTAEDALEVVHAASRLPQPPSLEWVGKPFRSAGVARARSLRVVLEQRNELFGVLGELSVFGERVELARLVEAVRREAAFVRVSSTDFLEIHDSLRALIRPLADHGREVDGALQVGPAALEHLHAMVDAGVRFQTIPELSRVMTRAAQAKNKRHEVPAGFAGTLRPYQLDGFRWLMRLASLGAGGVLADEMGLGKTMQALAVLTARASVGPALVVAPTSVGFVWADEAKRVAPGLKVIHYASADRDQVLASADGGDVVVVSYGLLVRDLERLRRVVFGTVVFDEAQELKNPFTQRFLAARGLRSKLTFALSGTPLENHLGELWSIFALVFPSLLGDWEHFRTRFAMPIEKNLDPAAAPALSRVLAPYVLRRTKAEVETELPSRTEVTVPVTLSPEEWTLYEDTRLAALSDLESARARLKAQQRKVQVLAMLTRLRLAAAHPKLLEASSSVPSSKLRRVVELLEGFHARGERTLVFSQFTSLLDLLEPALMSARLGFTRLDGGTPVRERRRRVEAFSSGADPVFLLSLKAGGTGLTLTEATNVVLLDPWWNPWVERQAGDRSHRIGQRRPVTIYRLIAEGTVEERMLTIHARKRALFERVLSGSSVSGTLSTEELIALMTTESEQRR